jgi:hypothetical protein
MLCRNSPSSRSIPWRQSFTPILRKHWRLRASFRSVDRKLDEDFAPANIRQILPVTLHPVLIHNEVNRLSFSQWLEQEVVKVDLVGLWTLLNLRRDRSAGKNGTAHPPNYRAGNRPQPFQVIGQKSQW